MIYVYILVFLFGLAIGSFLNVIIFRLKKGKSPLKGRSYCPKCKHKLNWIDLIPFLGFFIRKGKCHYCGKKISRQYPSVELAAGLLFVFVCWYYFSMPGPKELFIIRDLVFVSILIVIFVYDLKYKLILDKVSLPAAGFAILYNVLLGYPRGDTFTSLLNLILAGAIGAGFFLLQFWLSKGKWIGGGDIRLGLLMGFMVGWPLIFVALFLSYIGGAVVGLFLLASKKKTLKAEIPFGIFLAPATFLTIFYGQQLLNWYLSRFLI